MDVRELAAREHENLLVSTAAVVSNAPGSRIEHDRGILLFAVPVPLRVFNQVAIEREDADPDALAAAVRVMRERGARYVVNLREGMDDAYVRVVRALGLVEMGPDPWLPGMAASPLPPPGNMPVPHGLEIRRVAELDGLRDHVATAAAGFEMPPEWLEPIVGPDMLGDPAAALYVGYADDAPVTTGIGYRTGSTIGVYNIATVKRARRRGYGAAMTMRVVDDAVAAGCDVAVLQASEMGLPVYERLGFRVVVRYRGWIEPEMERANPDPSADGEPRT